ncbi:hypothetical protein H9P43_005376 [Blastocladiella emersonii ATCC 22665]|nr:hypothetical protein H9P43_005376 [Blastocladiella emersonii ATCC 22665]
MSRQTLIMPSAVKLQFQLSDLYGLLSDYDKFIPFLVDYGIISRPRDLCPHHAPPPDDPNYYIIPDRWPKPYWACHICTKNCVNVRTGTFFEEFNTISMWNITKAIYFWSTESMTWSEAVRYMEANGKTLTRIHETLQTTCELEAYRLNLVYSGQGRPLAGPDVSTGLSAECALRRYHAKHGSGQEFFFFMLELIGVYFAGGHETFRQAVADMREEESHGRDSQEDLILAIYMWATKTMKWSKLWQHMNVDWETMNRLYDVLQSTCELEAYRLGLVYSRHDSQLADPNIVVKHSAEAALRKRHSKRDDDEFFFTFLELIAVYFAGGGETFRQAVADMREEESRGRVPQEH